LDEVRAWLRKAERDFVSAQILTEHEPPVLETAAFHCQQAVEKTLKAYLVWKSIPFEKVHSLTYLLDLCEASEPGFATIRERAEALAPYAVEVRYPGELAEITVEEAREALDAAREVWAFVLGLLPPEVVDTFKRFNVPTF